MARADNCSVAECAVPVGLTEDLQWTVYPGSDTGRDGMCRTRTSDRRVYYADGSPLGMRKCCHFETLLAAEWNNILRRPHKALILGTATRMSNV